MRAVGVTTYGGPEALHEIDVPQEPLGAADVRIRVTAAGVNPTDTGVRSGLRDDKPAPPPPGVVPGMDVAGEVVEVGADAGTGVSVGDRVMAIVVPSGTHGGYRSEVVVPARSATRVQSTVTTCLSRSDHSITVTATPRRAPAEIASISRSSSKARAIPSC